MKMSLITAIAFGGLIVTTTTACTTSTGSPGTATSTTSARSTLTAAQLQPPPQHNAPGNKDVVFDPCTWVDDSTATKAGLDPKSRRRGDDLMGENTVYECEFDSGGYGVSLSSTNRTLDSFRTSTPHGGKLIDITVAGRPALEQPGGALNVGGVCNVTMQTADGALDVQVTGNDPNSANLCPVARNVASVVATSLPKG